MGGDFRKGVCFTREMDVELDREQSAVGGAHTPPQKEPTPLRLEPVGLLASPARGGQLQMQGACSPAGLEGGDG